MPILHLVDEGILHPSQILGLIAPRDIGLRVDRSMDPAVIAHEVVKAMESFVQDGAKKRRVQGLKEDPASHLITAIRILAFGEGGKLFLGAGVNAQNAAKLAPLRNWIRAGQGSQCDLLGCNVATVGPPTADLVGTPSGSRVGAMSFARGSDTSSVKATEGYRLLSSLAFVLGIPVKAGLEPMQPAGDWQFAGATMTVDPFGEVRLNG